MAIEIYGRPPVGCILNHLFFVLNYAIYVRKGKVLPKQAVKAQRGRRGIAILFLDLGT